MKKVEKKAKSPKKSELDLAIRELEIQVPEGGAVHGTCARVYCVP